MLVLYKAFLRIIFYDYIVKRDSVKMIVPKEIVPKEIVLKVTKLKEQK